MAFRRFALVLILSGAACGQSLVQPEELAAAKKAFDSSERTAGLRCDIRPVLPALDFGFRFQTGYVADIPFNQFGGPGHNLKILLRVTPEGREASYMATTGPLPAAPAMKVDAEVTGTFVVGEGAYGVEALVEDDQRRVCRGKWRIQAKLSGGERELKPVMPPSTVEEVAQSHPKAAESKASPRIERLTVMMHVAPLSPRASNLQPGDVLTLVGSLSSLLDQLPALSVRLVMFNLDQQKVLFRKDDLTSNDLGEVTTALNHVHLSVVDYRTLESGVSPVDLLAELVQTELRDPKPSDGVILLGPPARREEVPAKSPNAHPVAIPPFFYVQYLPRQTVLSGAGADPPMGRGGRGALRPLDSTVANKAGFGAPVLPDSIEQLMKRVKGETIPVRTPHDFADAIRHMAGRIRTVAPAGEALPALRPPQAGPDQMVPVSGSAPDGNAAAVSPRQEAAPEAVAVTPDKIPPAEPSVGDEDPVEILVRLRDQVLAHGALIPNHTCVETVQRDRYEPAAGRLAKSCDAIVARRKQSGFPMSLRLDSTDRLRLDVALASDREIYSWAGAARFEEGEIDELIPEGAIGTGPFASMLLAIFQTASPRFVFEGDTTMDARRLMEYSFSVPLEESHYRVKAGKEWVTTGYTGTLLVDPQTAELVRLAVRTEELPAATTICETQTTLDYGMVPLGGVDYLLPKATRQRFIGRDGAEGENAIAFASCREYRGESSVTFGEKTTASGGAGGAASQPYELPAGLPFTVELTATLHGDQAAAGDRIEGRLVKPIRDARHEKTLVPEGTRVEGRLMRVETRHAHPELIVALRWESLEINGVKAPFRAMPNRRAEDLKTRGQGGLRQRGMEIELPLPSESRYGVYHFPGEKAAVTSGFRSEWVTAQL